MSNGNIFFTGFKDLFNHPDYEKRLAVQVAKSQGLPLPLPTSPDSNSKDHGSSFGSKKVIVVNSVNELLYGTNNTKETFDATNANAMKSFPPLELDNDLTVSRYLEQIQTKIDEFHNTKHDRKKPSGEYTDHFNIAWLESTVTVEERRGDLFEMIKKKFKPAGWRVDISHKDKLSFVHRETNLLNRMRILMDRFASMMAEEFCNELCDDDDDDNNSDE
jgi:hypothetical protein